MLAKNRSLTSSNRGEISDLQHEKLLELMAHAHANSPYWRRTLDALDVSPRDAASPDAFSRIPFMTKATFREFGRDLGASGGTRGRSLHKSTGGSTGQRIWFTVDLNCADERKAAALLADEWDGVRTGDRIATIWSSPLDAVPSLPSRTFDWLTGRLFLGTPGIDPGTAQRFWQRLLSFRPKALISYPSLLVEFVRAIGRRAARELGLEVVFTSAEVLTSPVRDELETSFESPVRNRYASREFGLIAAQCGDSPNLHVLDQRFILEIIEFEQGVPEIVVTDLDNYATPFIRYRTEDSAKAVSGHCPCGRPFSRIGPVDGRVFDRVVTPDGKILAGTYLTTAMKTDDRCVEDFQIVQDARDHVSVRVVVASGTTPVRLEAFRRELESKLFGLRCTVEPVREIPRLSSGKRRFVIGLP